MTPLARRLVNELTLPRRSRMIVDTAGLIRRMDDIHCFDCTAVIDLAKRMGAQLMQRASVDSTIAFLPAKRTWIEYREASGKRAGFLLRETRFAGAAHSATVDVAVAVEIDDGNIRTSQGSVLLLQAALDRDPTIIDFLPSHRRPDDTLFVTYVTYALLALINTPRIIGRRQHMPHRGLERRLLHAMKPIGKFPLHAWTEIRLEVAAPKDMIGEESNEAHLTGQRALHFCRAHLRIRCGKVEIVRAHWRGDASLGIKQSRYRLELPRGAIS